MQAILSALNIDEDTPISAKILTRQIEEAQKRIEGRNFSARKYVLQYDDVNNFQRNLVYADVTRCLRQQHSRRHLKWQRCMRSKIEDAARGRRSPQMGLQGSQRGVEREVFAGRT